MTYVQTLARVILGGAIGSGPWPARRKLREDPRDLRTREAFLQRHIPARDGRVKPDHDGKAVTAREML